MQSNNIVSISEEYKARQYGFTPIQNQRKLKGQKGEYVQIYQLRPVPDDMSLFTQLAICFDETNKGFFLSVHLAIENENQD